MKLRRYGQFINESVELTDELINVLVERGEFWDRLMEMDYSRFDFTQSYSDMCKREGRNPKADFEKIQKYFDEKGFTLEKLKDIFSKEWDKKCGYNLYELYCADRAVLNNEPFKSILSDLKSEAYPSSMVVKNKMLPEEWLQSRLKKEKYTKIIEPFSVGPSLDSQNAAVDVYLYFLFEELRVSGMGPVWLGGDVWGNVDLEDDDGGGYSEAFIRYRYGYHQTEYGKLWMEQCGVDENWLRERAMEDLQNYLEGEFCTIIRKVDRSRVWPENITLDSCSIIEEDRIIIDLSKVAEVIKNSPVNKYWKGGTEFPVDAESIAARFTRELEGFKLDIELTDTGDLIIWGRFKED